MRSEKQIIRSEYLNRLNGSPYFIAVDYKGLTVTHFTELRKALNKAGAEVHVVKNSIFRLAAKETGIDLAGGMEGQLAVVTGDRDISAAAKALKTFQTKFDRPKTRFGYLENRRLEANDLKALADLPSLEVLRATLLGVMNAPAGKLVRLFNTPASQLAQVLKAKVDKESNGESKP